MCDDYWFDCDLCIVDWLIGCWVVGDVLVLYGYDEVVIKRWCGEFVMLCVYEVNLWLMVVDWVFEYFGL